MQPKVAFFIKVFKFAFKDLMENKLISPIIELCGSKPKYLIMTTMIEPSIHKMLVLIRTTVKAI